MSNSFSLLSAMRETAGSGTVYGDGRIEFIYAGARGTGEKALEELRKICISGGRFRGYYVDLSGCKMSGSSCWDKVYISCATSATYTPVEKKRGIGDRVCSLELEYIDMPITRLPNYLACWDHNLYYAVPATDEALSAISIPDIALQLMESDQACIPPYLQKLWRWGTSAPGDQTITEKTDDGEEKEVVYRWVMAVPMVKPGVDSKPTPVPVVLEKVFFASESAAYENLKRAGTHVAPSKTYIYSKDPAHWLCFPSGVVEEDGFFVSQNRYKYADEWDAELWGGAGGTGSGEATDGGSM